MSVGAERFCEELRVLGIEPTILSDAYPNHVIFDFEVPFGSLMGRHVKLGFAVPLDFPMTAPSGPHHTPIIVNDDGSGRPPRGGLHLNHDASFKTVTNEDWQYWSRPYPSWAAPAQPVRAYLAFIKQLWSLL